jgi:hypothetical protein
MTAIAIAALIVFIAGIAAGIIVVVSVGIRREERELASRREELDFPLTLQAPDGVTQGARLVAGLNFLNVDAGADAASRETMLV